MTENTLEKIVEAGIRDFYKEWQAAETESDAVNLVESFLHQFALKIAESAREATKCEGQFHEHGLGCWNDALTEINQKWEAFLKI